MRRWPWITMLVAALLALNPIGLDFIHSAFFAGEQLTRNIAQPIVMTAALIALAAVALEWLIRWLLARRGGA